MEAMLTADQANRRYFREAYRSGLHGWAVEEPSAYAVHFLKRVQGLVAGGRLLDVGCGEGRHSIAAAQLGFRVVGVDYERLALKRARRFASRKGVMGITFREGNLFDLPFPEASFDVVLDYGCLHHQRKGDWPAYKAAVLRVLRPEGFFVLSTFSRHFHMFRGSRRSWHIAHGAYRRCFSRKEIVGLFAREFAIMEIAEEREEVRGFWHVLMQRRAGIG